MGRKAEQELPLRNLRILIVEADALAQAITSAYSELCRRAGKPALDVAVRSSATAEDLPDASFAGQQESYRSA